MSRPLPRTVDDVIDRWPPGALARNLGLPSVVVRLWRHRGNIPERHWASIEALAVRCGFRGITYARLADIARGLTSASGPGAPAPAPAQE